MTWLQVLHEEGGVADVRRLSAAGLGRTRRHCLVQTGQLLALAPGVVALPGATEGWLGELRTAVAAAGPMAFAHRRSAGAVWDLDGCVPPGSHGPEVAVARDRHARAGVHRVSGLAPGDIVRRDGLRVTSPARTLVDLGAVCPPEAVEWALEAALRRRLVSEVALREAGVVRRRWRGSVLSDVLARRPSGAPATESIAEIRFVQLCRAGAIEDPQRQWEQVLGRRYRLDFAWPPQRVAAEVDGASVHGPDALAADLRRQNRVVLAGWLILRFTWDDIVLRPDETLAVVRAALAAGTLGVHRAW